MARSAEPRERAETKCEAFKRLAEKRANSVLNEVRVLSNCANRSTYEYDQSDIDEIFGTIEEELRKAKAKFQPADTARIRLR